MLFPNENQIERWKKKQQKAIVYDAYCVDCYTDIVCISFIGSAVWFFFFLECAAVRAVRAVRTSFTF